MHLLSFFASSLLASTALAGRSLKHVNMDLPEPKVARRDAKLLPRQNPSYGGPSNQTVVVQNNNTKKYAVDGSNIPFVDWDAGESYAGLMPISDEPDVSELYFWFWPSHNPEATDEILIWLNGGPGCSSLEGFLQENGPFLWQYGTYRPVQNPYTWINLTNVVWIEQPAGTGFSPQKKTPPATNEVEVAAQFLGFWKNFVDTFELHNRKIYIAGESYAGYYVPYIADAMHNETDKEYYGIESILFYDPVVSYESISGAIPAVPMVEYWEPLFSFNDTFMQYLRDRHQACGYADFMQTAMQFPPSGPLPDPPPHSIPGCDLFREVFYAAQEVNPCWDIYQIATTCPNLWDVMGFPGSFFYEPAPWTYFNRTDVKQAINAPMTDWAECSGGVLETDTSPPVGLGILPRVIEKNTKTIIGHGMLDFILLMNGTVMATQNMTWGGAQGFHTPPSEWNDFYVPYHSELNLGSTAGAGVFGKWWEERGFAICTVDLSGHMVS